MNISITGGTGFIGKLLCLKLLSMGNSVVLLSRKESKIDSIPVVMGDLVDGSDALDAFVANADIIYHCAGEVKDSSLMYNSHVRGTSNLLAAVQRRIRRTGRPVHWVQLSSTGAYGHQGDLQVVNETFQPAPVGNYEITKTIADELVISLSKLEPLFSFTLLRPSIVIGSTMPNRSFFQLANVVRRKMFFYIGDKKTNTSTYVHVNDVVRALVACGNDQRAVGKIFILSNDCLQSEVIQSFADHAGVSAPRLQLPEKILRLIVSTISPFVNLPLTNERIDALVKKGGYDSSYICKTLDFSFENSIPKIVPDVLTGHDFSRAEQE